MNKSIFPTALLGALLIAAVGATTAGRGPARGGDAAATPATPAAVEKQVPPQKGSESKSDEDPVRKAGRLGEAEADEDLKERICGFLAEYGLPDDAVVEAQQHTHTKPDNTYCVYSDADKAEAVDPADLPVPDPAVRPKVVIAVLPDPVHTQLALRFDEAADELQNSMQDLGWTYDRAWLPWDNKQHEDEADFDKRMANKIAQEGVERSPGAIMFRANPDDGTTQPLIVLVVGDTPTGGVDAAMFGNAIKIWQQLTGWSNYFSGKAGATATSDADQLSILGPTYSGATASLHGLLRKLTAQVGKEETDAEYFCPTRPLEIDITSGTISDEAGLEYLAEEDDPFCTNLKVQPRSFAANQVYEYDRLESFIKKHGSLLFSKNDAQPVKWAILTEAESRFGSEPANYRDQSLHLSEENIEILRDKLEEGVREQNLAQDANLKSELNSELPELRVQLDALRVQLDAQIKERDLLKKQAPIDARHLHFPREISKLRAAYEQDNIFGYSGSSNTVKTELHLSLGGSTIEDDTVHTFSGNQSAAAEESGMVQLASELEREKVEVVILSATDVLDEMFVTRYLSQHAPNTAVIVTDMDGLFLRGGDASMQNAYVVGPWPLIPGNGQWSYSGDVPRRIHDSASGQGLYAAVRWMVCTTKEKASEKCGESASVDANGKPVMPPIPEYQLPVATDAATPDELKLRPPLWLSIVGRGGVWPIALVDVDQAGQKGLAPVGEYNLPLMDSSESGPAPGIYEKNPLAITIMTGLLALLLGIHALACLRARLDRSFAWSYALADEGHHFLRLTLQTAITLAAIPALVLLKTPNEAGVHIRTGHYSIFNWLLQIAVAVLAGLPWVLRASDRSLEGLKEIWKTRSRAIRWLIVWVVASAAVLWFSQRFFWWVIAPPASKFPTERAFFFYRSGHLFCGSSPALPVLLLLAALVFCMVSLFDRLVFYNSRIPRLPDIDKTLELHCPNDKDIARLNALLSGPVDKDQGFITRVKEDPWRWGLFLAVLASLGLLVLGLHEVVPQSLTHGRFDVVMITLSAVVTVLLMYYLATAVTAWVFLRVDCLLPLSRSPLRWGFTWIQGWSWRRIWAPGAISPDGVLDYLRRLAEANRRAMNDPALQTAFANLRAQLVSEPRNALWATKATGLTGELHQQLAKTASNKLYDLQQMWKKDFGPISGTEPKERGLRAELPLEKYEHSKPADKVQWRRTQDRMAKEEFVAMLYLGYIRMVLLQIRNRIMTASGMYILLLWALTSYPFLNHHTIVIGLTCLMVGLAAVAIWIYSQMHRDDILSRTTETTSGKLGADFFTKILSMVGIPLLTLIASQFPEISNVVFSWLEPGLSTMK